jgi:PleD family two-component response regulator
MTDRPRILIADDHCFVVELCKRLLETDFDVAVWLDNGRAF